MLLYLIRHAEAEDVGTGGVTRDFDRPLTARGRADTHALAEAFARRNLAIDAVAASPLVRAHQTAVEFLSVLAPSLRVVTCDELAIDKLKPGKLSEFLGNIPAGGDRVPSREEKAVAAVGHMPDLGTYFEWLVGAAPGTVRLAKPSAACLRFKGDPDKASGTLEWLVTPEWFG
jgi:phosphohistidine phosphatase